MKVHIIINPAAGRDEPVLATLNRLFSETGHEWDVSITKGAEDATDQAREAALGGADIVAAYGGDGTVMGVAAGLMGTGVPLAILPGGTANVLSVELGIPQTLAEATALIGSPESRVINMDVGEIAGQGKFVLRVGIGLNADMIAAASREAKDRLGSIAYVQAFLQSFQEREHSNYRITVDGQVHECSGITCLIANAKSLGFAGLHLGEGISVTDGLLDVFVLQQVDFGTMVKLVGNMVVAAQPPEIEGIARWCGREIRVEADPPQSVQHDGETCGETPIAVRVIPAALPVLVPAIASPET